MTTSVATVSLAERADALEHQMIDELESVIPTKSVLYLLADGKREFDNGMKAKEKHPNAKMLMDQDPRLPRMPEKPELLDFFKYRFAPANHLLQSATHALKAGMDEKIILACLLHDIAVSGFIRVDHGYWGAQLVEPYVDEEVSWAIRSHQALRFFADESVGYAYPEMYIKHFGADYEPDDYIKADYEKARKHKWYMTARLICVHDIYSFDPNAKVDMNDFIDIVGRNFKQPKEGLGFDGSPVAHMWRTLIRPTKYL
jgi:HD domain